jgi:hypothetical protein
MWDLPVARFSCGGASDPSLDRAADGRHPLGGSPLFARMRNGPRDPRHRAAGRRRRHERRDGRRRRRPRRRRSGHVVRRGADHGSRRVRRCVFVHLGHDLRHRVVRSLGERVLHVRGVHSPVSDGVLPPGDRLRPGRDVRHAHLRRSGQLRASFAMLRRARELRRDRVVVPALVRVGRPSALRDRRRVCRQQDLRTPAVARRVHGMPVTR